MPIVIKELFPSDPISEALEKINFNFDQLILAGGGPPGPQGNQGVQGVPGPQGERGDHWQVSAIAPTADHAPSFGPLVDTDHWLNSSNGDIFQWNASSTSWINTGLNLKGPTGEQGSTGGSLEWSIYLGDSNNGVTGNLGGQNWIPTSQKGLDDSELNFLAPNDIFKNNLFLGDTGWSEQYLANFSNIRNGVVDVDPFIAPKLTLIQRSIDSRGFGGFVIGAYGLTGGTGTDVNLFVGGIGNTAVAVDARDMFYAGIATSTNLINSIAEISHVFRARTNTIDFEIQAGDLDSVVSNSKSPKILLKSDTIRFNGIFDVDPIRAEIGSTGLRVRDRVAIGYNSTQGFPNTSTWDPSILHVNGWANIQTAINISPETPTFDTRLVIGYNRSGDGASFIDLITDTISTRKNGEYATRIGRGGNGPNAETYIAHKGSGDLTMFLVAEGGSTPWTSQNARFIVRTGTADVNQQDIFKVHGGGSNGPVYGNLNRFGKVSITKGDGSYPPLHDLDIGRILGMNTELAAGGILTSNIQHNWWYGDSTSSSSGTVGFRSTSGGPGSYIQLRGGGPNGFNPIGTTAEIGFAVSSIGTPYSLPANGIMTMREYMTIGTGGVGINTQFSNVPITALLDIKGSVPGAAFRLRDGSEALIPTGQTAVMVSPASTIPGGIGGYGIWQPISSIISSIIPVGTITMYYGNAANPPAGWLACVKPFSIGSQQPVETSTIGKVIQNNPAHTALYNHLLANGCPVIVSPYYGNYIQTPEFNGRFPVGVDVNFSLPPFNQVGYQLGSTGGQNSVTLTLEQIPSHVHQQNGSSQTNFGGGGRAAAIGGNFEDAGNTFPAGGDPLNGVTSSHENRPPYLGILFIIKL